MNHMKDIRFFEDIYNIDIKGASCIIKNVDVEN